MFLLSFSPSKFTKDAKGSYVREELFEPLNAILLPNTTIAYIPFIAGWVCSEPGQQGELQRIEVWAIDGEEMRYVSTKMLGVTLDSCYLDGYYDYSFNEKEVKRVEPECKQDESGGYYLCYDDTLKEAIGFSRGEPPSDWYDKNYATISKIYDSNYLGEGIVPTTLEIDLSDIYEEVEIGEDYVLVLKGYFKRAGVTEDPIPIEREVSLYLRAQLNTDYYRNLNFYKGDGHLHSKHSDGWPAARIDHGFNEPEFFKRLSIAHYRRTEFAYDWLIMSDHADYFWNEQISRCKNRAFDENKNFNEYVGACQNAESIERQESGRFDFAVVPAEEITVCTEPTNCSNKCYNCSEGTTSRGKYSSDILNYYGCNTGTVLRFPNKLINGTDFVKNKAGDYTGTECQSLTGPDGWDIIAHPGGSPDWKLFPKTAEDWTKQWNYHICPSVIRSMGDDDETNDGYGFMGIEVISANNVDTQDWDNYLHTDLSTTVSKWVHNVLKTKGNNFIVGVGNSDAHFWHYLVEDLQALKAGHNSGFCLVSDCEEREVPHFPQYWKAQWQTLMFSAPACTFVCIPGWDGSHSMLLNSLRMCGKDHKGVSASRRGDFATFTANGIPSGGKLTLSSDLNIAIWAYPLININTPCFYEGIKEIRIFHNSNSSSPPYTPRLLREISYPLPGDTLPPKMDGWIVTIPGEEIDAVDYIRIEVDFIESLTYGATISTCYCNPVIIEK